MNCPRCDNQKLQRTKYIDANVRECSSCGGLLLKTSRATKIERRIDKNHDALHEEIAKSTQDDSIAKMRCPSCRDIMQKRSIRRLDFLVDDCESCGMSWFDGGELAAIQLNFEQKAQTVELNAMRDRLRSMTDSERAEYEQNLANLKDLGSSFSQACRGATIELLSRRHWRT